MTIFWSMLAVGLAAMARGESRRTARPGRWRRRALALADLAVTVAVYLRLVRPPRP